MNLEHNKLLYLPIMEVIRRKTARILWEGDHSIVLQDMLSGVYMGASDDLSEADQVLAAIPVDAKEVQLFHKTMFEAKFKHHILSDLTSYNSVYLKDEDCVVKLPKGYSIQPLHDCHIPFVMKHYSVDELCYEEHMKERIDAGMLGVFYQSEVVGFIGTHSEGAIGMLEILPEHRHRGLGMALQKAMTNELRQKGCYVYGQVMQNNTASFALQKKSGFIVCDEPTYWYFHD